MAVLEFGKRIVKDGDTAHLGSIEIADIEYITFTRTGDPAKTITYSHFASPSKLRDFWMLNGDQLLKWHVTDNEHQLGQWEGGGNSKYECLLVWVKP